MNYKNHDKLMISVFFNNDKRLNGNYRRCFLQYKKHKKYKNIYDYLSCRFDDLSDSSIMLKESLYRILRHVEKRPCCPVCGRYTQFNHQKQSCYNEHCSKSCAISDPVVNKKQKETKMFKYGSINNMKKTKETCMDRYGVTNVAKSGEVKEKIKNTNIERYGFICPLQNSDIQEKTKQTNIKRYNSEYAQSTQTVKDKIRNSNKESCFHRYGVTNIAKLESTTIKRENTCIMRYGFDNISKAQAEKSRLIKEGLYDAKLNIILSSQEIQSKIKQTCIERYGVDSAFKSDKLKEKSRQTSIERYGQPYWSMNEKNRHMISNLLSSDEVQSKIRQTCVGRYGVDNAFKSDKLKEKSRQTSIERYGQPYWSMNEKNRHMISNLLSSDEVQSKIRQTCIERYGVDSAFKSDKLKEKGRQTSIERYGKPYWSMNEENRRKLSVLLSSDEVQLKINETKKKNHTFNTSSDEDKTYDLLKKKWLDVCRQFRSERYPFNCDFYIPSLDLYIECNFHWTHGGHPYSASEEDLQKVEQWRSKHTKYYDNAIHVWTVSDVNKRNTAQKNQLNYIEFWNLDELKIWIDKK